MGHQSFIITNRVRSQLGMNNVWVIFNRSLLAEVGRLVFNTSCSTCYTASLPFAPVCEIRWKELSQLNQSYNVGWVQPKQGRSLTRMSWLFFFSAKLRTGLCILYLLLATRRWHRWLGVLCKEAKVQLCTGARHAVKNAGTLRYAVIRKVTSSGLSGVEGRCCWYFAV